MIMQDDVQKDSERRTYHKQQKTKLKIIRLIWITNGLRFSEQL